MTTETLRFQAYRRAFIVLDLFLVARTRAGKFATRAGLSAANRPSETKRRYLQ
jgi:hypothetical protein